MIDSTKKLSKQDKNIINWAIERGTPIVILFSKFDLVPEEKKKKVMSYYDKELSVFDWIPRIYVSSVTMEGIEKSLSLALEVVDKLKNKYPNLEEVVREAIDYRPPPDARGKVELYSVKQYGTNIVLEANEEKSFDEQYKKYLENRIRKKIDFEGIPISVKLERR